MAINVYLDMSTLRTRLITSSLLTFFEKNKKVLISTLVLFVIGIIIGVILAYRAVDGSFERVPRIDIEVGSAKVFFISSLCLLGCYGIILVAGINNKTVFLICIPFVLLGYFCGKFACALVCRFEGFGIINLVIIYLPFFLITFVLMMLATASILSSSCSDRCEGSNLKPSFIRVLKIFGINIACGFVLFIIVGSIAGGVIIVTLF